MVQEKYGWIRKKPIGGKKERKNRKLMTDENEWYSAFLWEEEKKRNKQCDKETKMNNTNYFSTGIRKIKN